MSTAGLIDPTKTGKYPVVLSDALLGKKPSEVYTGVRYNHRPDVPPDSAKLRQNATKGSYDLTYGEKGGLHKYRGNRSNNENQYALIFDPKREVFVLHKIDSTFNMNLAQTPGNKDAESLKREYPHLKNSSAEVSSSRAKGAAASQGTKAQKKAEPKPKPKPKPAAAPAKQKTGSDEEESDDNDDGGLEIDFGDTAAPNRDFSPAFPPRRFSEFAEQNDEEEDDADGEDEDEEMSDQEHFPLPSPIVHQPAASATAPLPNNTISLTFDDDSASDEDEEPAPAPVQYQQEQQDEDEDMEDDLEAALEAELGAELESDVSEED
ncbi:ell-associated factor [Seiridium cupressi]